MRQIGQLTDQEQAATFSDFLVGRGVRNQLEREADGAWSIWILDEDQLADAQACLARFVMDPRAKEFREATAAAIRARAAESQDLEAYRRRVRTRRSLFPRIGGYGVGILTYALIVTSVVVALYSNFGENKDALQRLFISNPKSGVGGFLPEVFSGEVWRLFTPIFIHFGYVHLIFNMMWLYQLGSMIEGRRNALVLATLVAGVALVSNLAQFIVMHSPGFGGMSGVIYGLAGYVWMCGKYDRGSGLYLDPTSITILLVWLVVCYTGAVGPIANTAHLAGLIVGMIWGRIAAMTGTRTPE